MKILKVIELFAGVGGFRLGLEGYQGKSASSYYKEKLKQNYKIVWANQYEPSTIRQSASEIYEKKFKSNKNNHSRIDIKKVKVKVIPEHDVLVGGFPCQDYSVANSLRTASGILGAKGPKKIPRTPKIGKPYIFAEGKMPLLDSLDLPAWTIITAEGGISPSRFKHIIKDKNNRHRRLIPSELEQLNMFPKNFTEMEEKSSKRAFFMGNALVVGVVEMIGEAVYEDFLNRQ